jgi:hypothetical protein
VTQTQINRLADAITKITLVGVEIGKRMATPVETEESISEKIKALKEVYECMYWAYTYSLRVQSDALERISTMHEYVNESLKKLMEGTPPS